MKEDIIHNQFPVLSGKPSHFFQHRKTALRWIQLLSGKEWTDYNTHDPGVTILEALCYTLTEIEYKLDFSIEDILSSSSLNKTFNLSNNALFLAEDILTTAPVTIADYRKLIIDAVPEINNVWLMPSEENNTAFEVILLKKKQVETPIAIERVTTLLKQYRAFGVPHMKVKAAKFTAIALKVDMYIDNDKEAETILAEMFYTINEYLINPNPLRQPFTELEEHWSYNKIFDGPKMHNGIIKTSNLSPFLATVTSITIKKIVSALEGVQMINNLSIYDNESLKTQKEIDTNEAQKESLIQLKKGYVPFFTPKHLDNNIRVYKNKELMAVNFFKVFEIIENMVRVTSRNYVLKNEVNQKTYSINAKNRNIKNYYSIKNDFPQAYGLNENGYAYIQNQEAYSTDQLKAYLLPFEQIIANTFMRLAHTSHFFSITALTENVLHQPLYWEDSRVEQNHINIFSTQLTTTKTKLNAVEINPINRLKARNNMLTHLLARFDVHLDDNFEMHSFHSEADHLSQEIRSKELLLQNIKDIGYNRNIYNSEEVTSLEKEIYLRLSINEIPEKPLYRAVSKLKYNIIEIKNKKVKHVDATKIDDSIYSDLKIERIKNFSYSQHTIAYHTHNKNLIPELLYKGSNKGAYKIVEAANRKQNYVVLEYSDQNHAKLLTIEKTKKAALNQVHYFVDTFNAMSNKSEGFYLIDHALLEIDDSDFTTFRMSFVFPDWSTRFQNKGFRKEAERIIIKLVPAHICARFLWLDLEEMTRFEDLHLNWKQALNRTSHTTQELSYKLSDFLKKHLEKKGN
ncbi:hypothetical protein [Lacinutrix chionoecetis]